MSLTQKILSGLKDISRTQKIRKRGRYVTGTSTFDVKHFNGILSEVNLILEPIAKNGEKIVTKIDSGEIVDSGIRGFKIKKGVSIELYDYKLMSVSFIRLYHIQDNNKEWLALYVDENLDTPWWEGEER